MLRIAGRDCEYVLTAERDLPKEEQTVFVLRELNAVERKALDYDQPGSPFRLKKEQLEGGAKGEMVLVYDIPQSDDPATTRRNNEALAAHRKAYAGYLVEVFRRGVREVRNLTDGQGKAITLSLFDSEGQRIKQVRCDIRPLKANLAKMKELGVSGRLYALVAKVEPDPRVKRYEITTTRY